MAELFPTDAYLEGLSGLEDTATGVYYPAKGEGLDWYVSFVKCVYRLMRNVAVAGGLRVHKTGNLICGVKGGSFWDGTTLRTVTTDENVSLTDSATNYLYLLTDGTLTVNTTGFPAAATTSHVRLATIAVSSGTYTDDDITEYRSAHVFQPVGLIGADRLADAVADAMPAVSIAVGSESGDTIAVTVQVTDAQSNNNANRFVVHAWLADSAYGGETGTAPDGAVSWTTGAQLEEITAKKRWTAITDANGQAVVSVGESGAASWYLNVEIDGRIYASNVITFAL